MRSALLLFIGLMSAGVSAQTIQEFSWQQNSRFDLRFTLKNQAMNIKGELRDGARGVTVGKDGVSVELKSYTTELFLVAAITSENDDTGYIFLFERPQTDWIVMNPTPIRARKIAIMDDFETAMKDFKTVTDFSLANSMRKTVEFFQKNPTKRLQDLLSALETRDESLRTLPRPRAPGPANGGVRPGDVPAEGGVQPRVLSPGQDPRQPSRDNPLVPSPDGSDDDTPQPPVRRPRPRPQPSEQPSYDPYGRPTTPPPADDDWVSRERRQQQQRRRQAPPQVYTDPYTGQPRYYPTDRPRTPQYNRPQYAPPGGYYEPPRQRGFFENLFGQ